MTFRTLRLSLILTLIFVSYNSFSQVKSSDNLRLKYPVKNSFNSSASKSNSAGLTFADSLKKKLVTKKSISAIFISFGGGLSVPLDSFGTTAVATFGILGRLEFASTAIFPFVIGAQIDYFSYNSSDEFRTINRVTGYRTKILGLGLNIEYSIAKLLRSPFTMPFLTVDVKNNLIKREYPAENENLPILREETKISVGAGFGMTIFIFDFFAKYNYMKNNSYIGVYTKTKIPVIRF